MMAPMPSAVSDQGPSVFLQALFRGFGLGDQLVDGLAAEKLVVGGADDFGWRSVVRGCDKRVVVLLSAALRHWR